MVTGTGHAHHKQVDISAGLNLSRREKKKSPSSHSNLGPEPILPVRSNKTQTKNLVSRGSEYEDTGA